MNFRARCRSCSSGWRPAAAGVASLPRHRRASAGRDASQLWILGSSAYGAQLAAYLGLPYAFAYFFNDGAGVEEALSLYRSLFRPSAVLARPQATICVWALAADTAGEAARLATAREHWRVGFEKGVRAPLISPEDGGRVRLHACRAARRSSACAPTRSWGRRRRWPSGCAHWRRGCKSRKIVINTWTFDPEARRRSYALLAEVFHLVGAPP